MTDREKLFERYAPDAERLALHYWHQWGFGAVNLEEPDVKQEAYLVLLRCIDGYEPEKGEFPKYLAAALYNHLRILNAATNLIALPHWTAVPKRWAGRRVERFIRGARSIRQDRQPGEGASLLEQPYEVDFHSDGQECDRLGVVLARMTDRDRDLLAERFGLDGRAPQSLRQLAAKRGRTHQAVSYASKQAINRARKLAA